MKRIISLLVIIAIAASLCGFGTVLVSAAAYSDVPEDHWAYAVVSELSDKAVIHGMGDGTYQPDANVTREQFIKLLICATDSYDPDIDVSILDQFEDVNTDMWSYPYIVNGLQSGTYAIDDLEKNCFKPEEPIDRGTVAKWIVNTLGLDNDVQQYVFDDIYDPEVRKAVGIASGAGLLEGYTDGTYKPDDFLTRAEAATVIKRVRDKYAEFVSVRPSENTIEYLDQINKLTSTMSQNTLVEEDAEALKYVFENADEALLAMNVGDKFVIEPCEALPGGIAVKVKDIQKEGNRVTIWNDEPQLEEFITKVDIAQKTPISLADVNETSIPEGITVTNSKGQTVAMAKAERENPTYYADNSDSASAEDDVKAGETLNFHLAELEVGNGLTINGDLAIGADFLVDVNWNWVGEKSVKATVESDTELSLSLNGKTESNDAEKIATSIPIIIFDVPIGQTGLISETTFFLDFSLEGEFSVSIKSATTSTNGFKYTFGVGNEKIKKNKSDVSVEAEATVKLQAGPGISSDISLLKTLAVELEACAGVEVVAALSYESKVGVDEDTENHSYDFLDGDIGVKECTDFACIDGDISLFLRVTPQLKLGRRSLLEFDIEGSWKMADFYVSWPTPEEPMRFGWGTCPNKKPETNEGESDVQLKPGENGAGNFFNDGFAVAAGDHIYYAADNVLYRMNSDGSNKITIVGERDFGYYSFSEIIVDTENDTIYATDFQLGGSTIYKIEDKENATPERLVWGLNYQPRLITLYDGYLYYEGNGKLHRIPVDNTDKHEEVAKAGHIDYVVGTYQSKIYYINDEFLNVFDIEMQKTEAICKDIGGYYNFTEDKIYFVTDDTVCSMNLDGSNIQEIFKEDSITSLNIANDAIYYTKPGLYGSHSLWQVGMDGTNPKILTDDFRYSLCIAGGRFFSRSSSGFDDVTIYDPSK